MIEETERIKSVGAGGRIEEHWSRYTFVYYQWKTDLSFLGIVRYIPIRDIIAMYMPYLEMDIRQFECSDYSGISDISIG